MEMKEKQITVDEGRICKGITIESSKGSRPKKVILEKPTVEMTRHIRSLYVKAHLNGKLVSKVFIDNGLAVNEMPLRMLRSLGSNIEGLIETKLFVSSFSREISKL